MLITRPARHKTPTRRGAADSIGLQLAPECQSAMHRGHRAKKSWPAPSADPPWNQHSFGRREKADAAGLLIVVGKSLKASHNQPIHQRDAGGITDGQPCRLLSRQQGHHHRHYTCGAEGVNQCARFDHLAAFRSQWNRPGNRTG